MLQMNINESSYSCCWIISAIELLLLFPMTNLFCCSPSVCFLLVAYFSFSNGNRCNDVIMVSVKQTEEKEKLNFETESFVFFKFYETCWNLTEQSRMKSIEWSSSQLSISLHRAQLNKWTPNDRTNQWETSVYALAAISKCC